MNDQPKSIETFHFSYSLDRKHFFRRACPKCGLEFKTKADPGDVASILQPAFRQLGLEIGEDPENGEDQEKPKTYLTCPYCGDQSEISDFLTPAFISYLKRFVLREIMLPKINGLFEDLANSVGHHKSGGGFLSIEFSMEFNRSLYPPRPIAGPEAPDMKIIDLGCCSKEIKILENWKCEIFCPYCSVIAVLR